MRTASKLGLWTPANVGLVDLELSVGAFESDEADGGFIGVNLSRRRDAIAGKADSDQLVEFEFDEETRKLQIQVDGLEYTLALIDPDSIRAKPCFSNPDLPAWIVIEGRDINRAAKAADMVSDHITTGVNEDDETFYIDAQGDTDDVHFEVAPEDVIGLISGPARSVCSIDALRDMNHAIPSDAEMVIDLSQEFHLR